eukprot:ANDGO_02737.mRNA.1 hypothetical protein
MSDSQSLKSPVPIPEDDFQDLDRFMEHSRRIAEQEALQPPASSTSGFDENLLMSGLSSPSPHRRSVGRSSSALASSSTVVASKSEWSTASRDAQQDDYAQEGFTKRRSLSNSTPAASKSKEFDTMREEIMRLKQEIHAVRVKDASPSKGGSSMSPLGHSQGSVQVHDPQLVRRTDSAKSSSSILQSPSSKNTLFSSQPAPQMQTARTAVAADESRDSLPDVVSDTEQDENSSRTPLKTSFANGNEGRVEWNGDARAHADVNADEQLKELSLYARSLERRFAEETARLQHTINVQDELISNLRSQKTEFRDDMQSKYQHEISKFHRTLALRQKEFDDRYARVLRQIDVFMSIEKEKRDALRKRVSVLQEAKKSIDEVLLRSAEDLLGDAAVKSPRELRLRLTRKRHEAVYSMPEDSCRKMLLNVCRRLDVYDVAALETAVTRVADICDGLMEIAPLKSQRKVAIP